MTPEELHETVLNGNWSAIKEAETHELWDFALNPVPDDGAGLGLLRRVIRELYRRRPAPIYIYEEEESDDTASDDE